jgi:hypothetical protein
MLVIGFRGVDNPAVNFTEEQVEAMLRLGITESDFEVVQPDMLQQLIRLGLVYHRDSTTIDFTEVGEAVYDELAGSPKSRTHFAAKSAQPAYGIAGRRKRRYG